MTALTLPVNEVFGPTFQGEGPHTGLPVGFLRLGTCNLACPWCDTPFTWDDTRYDLEAENPPQDVVGLAARILALNVPTMVLSGGEPLLHAKNTEACALGELLRLTPGVEWHVETNGTIPPPLWLSRQVRHYSVSPKINTPDRESKRLNPRALEAFSRLAALKIACWKFVCATYEDVDRAAGIAQEYAVPARAVWIMPQGTDTDTLLTTSRELAPRIQHYGYNLSQRLHVLLWGDTRGT